MPKSKLKYFSHIFRSRERRNRFIMRNQICTFFCLTFNRIIPVTRIDDGYIRITGDVLSKRECFNQACSLYKTPISSSFFVARSVMYIYRYI